MAVNGTFTDERGSKRGWRYYRYDMKRRPVSSTLRRQEFESTVAAMAEDPQIQAECIAIARDFTGTEMDGFGKKLGMATDERG